MTHDEYKEELAKVEAMLADPATSAELKDTLLRARAHLARKVACPVT